MRIYDKATPFWYLHQTSCRIFHLNFHVSKRQSRSSAPTNACYMPSMKHYAQCYLKVLWLSHRVGLDPCRLTLQQVLRVRINRISSSTSLDSTLKLSVSRNSLQPQLSLKLRVNIIVKTSKPYIMLFRPSSHGAYFWNVPLISDAVPIIMI